MSDKSAIPEDFLCAIGAVTVEFALLEFHIESIIWSLLGLTAGEDLTNARAVTAELSFRGRFNLFSTLIKHRFENHDALGLRKLITMMTKAEEERNIVVHSTWGLDAERKKDGTILRLKTTARGKMLKTNVQGLTAREIRAIAARINEATLELINFHCAMVPVPIVWPPRR